VHAENLGFPRLFPAPAAAVSRSARRDTPALKFRVPTRAQRRTFAKS
jgi:hypothetical protein